MLSCKEVTTQASDYLDGDLPLLRRLSFRLHLARCGFCRQFVSDLAEADRIVRSRGYGNNAPDPEFLGRVQSVVSSRLREDQALSERSRG